MVLVAGLITTDTWLRYRTTNGVLNNNSYNNNYIKQQTINSQYTNKEPTLYHIHTGGDREQMHSSAADTTLAQKHRSYWLLMGPHSLSHSNGPNDQQFEHTTLNPKSAQSLPDHTHQDSNTESLGQDSYIDRSHHPNHTLVHMLLFHSTWHYMLHAVFNHQSCKHTLFPLTLFWPECRVLTEHAHRLVSEQILARFINKFKPF